MFAALFLLFALQSRPTVSSATAADSAIARTTLLTGLAAFDAVSTHTDQQFAAKRYLEQLRIWAMKDEGGEAALRFDREWLRANGASAIYAADWLWMLLEAGDTLTSERFIAEMPEARRDGLIALAAGFLLWDRRPLPDWLEFRITNPSFRAEALAQRAGFTLYRDSTAGRELLREAVRLSQSDTVVHWHTYKWMISLLRLGDPVPMDDIVRAAMPGTDLWNARRVVAADLIDQDLPHLAAPLIDSLAAGISRLDPSRQAESRVDVHFLRRTSRDSALAKALLDSLDAASNPAPDIIRQRQVLGELGRLYRSGSLLNGDSLRTILSRPVSDSALAEYLRYLRSNSQFWTVDRTGSLTSDSLRSYLRIATDMIDDQIRSRPAAIRDSLQVDRVALMAYLGVPPALEFARTIPTPRFRDRAIGEIMPVLIKLDANAAEREANVLRDSTARARAFGALAQSAVAALRIAAADLFAVRATGTPLVRSLFELATAQQKGGQHEDARKSVNTAYDAMSAALWIEPQLLAELVFLTEQLGMRERALAWASRQEGDGPRANAYLLVAEAMSRRLLGWAPRFPLQ